MRHPDFERLRQTGEKPVLDGDGHLRIAVLTLVRRFHAAAEVLRHPLHAVTDAERRQAKPQKRRIGFGCVGIVDRAWATGQDEASRRECRDLLDRHRAGQDDREDVEFADAPRDQLRVLRTKVQDDNGRTAHADSVSEAGRGSVGRRVKAPAMALVRVFGAGALHTGEQAAAEQDDGYGNDPVLRCVRQVEGVDDATDEDQIADEVDAEVHAIALQRRIVG